MQERICEMIEVRFASLVSLLVQFLLVCSSPPLYLRPPTKAHVAKKRVR